MASTRLDALTSLTAALAQRKAEGADEIPPAPSVGTITGQFAAGPKP